MRDVCQICEENATVPGKLATRCADCLAEEFGLDDGGLSDQHKDLIHALARVAHVHHVLVDTDGVEVMLTPEARGVPVLVTHYLAEQGYLIQDVSPQGEPQHLIVRAE